MKLIIELIFKIIFIIRKSPKLLQIPQIIVLKVLSLENTHFLPRLLPRFHASARSLAHVLLTQEEKGLTVQLNPFS